MTAISVQLDLSTLTLRSRSLSDNIDNIAWAIAVRATNVLRVEAPKATSQMANSIRPLRMPKGASVLIGTNYAGFVHDGRKAGGVDGWAIADWAKAIGLPDSAVFPITRHIAKTGIKKHPWVLDYLDSSRFKSMVSQVVKNVMA